jgi:hypothetical protein
MRPLTKVFGASAVVGLLGIGCLLQDPTKAARNPNEYCDPSAISNFALVVPPNAQPGAASIDFSGDCNQCLQDNCCREIGECADDTSQCLDDVATNFKCLVKSSSAGTVNTTCGTLSGKEAALSTCLTTSCGARCGIAPALCQPSTSAPLVVGSDCDRCMSSNCCFDLNACYANRSCKNAFNCISACKDIPTSFFDDEAAIHKIENARENYCANDAGFPEGSTPDQFTPSDCVNNCLGDFFFGPENAAASAASFSTSAGCLSLNLFSCLGNQCKKDCNHTDQHDGATE